MTDLEVPTNLQILHLSYFSFQSGHIWTISFNNSWQLTPKLLGMHQRVNPIICQVIPSASKCTNITAGSNRSSSGTWISGGEAGQWTAPNPQLSARPAVSHRGPNCVSAQAPNVALMGLFGGYGDLLRPCNETSFMGNNTMLLGPAQLTGACKLAVKMCIF